MDDGNGRTLINAPEHPNATKMGYVYEYRLIVELTIGRLLQRDEIVHHVNGDCTDNRPENLDVMSQSEHIRLHKPKLGYRKCRTI